MDFPLPNPALPLNQQDIVTLASSIICGEGANQTDTAKFGIGMVMRNRWLRKVGFGSTWAAVLLQENAFSCTIPGSTRYPVLFSPLKFETRDTWQRCYLAGSIAYYGFGIPDPTMGAHFYHDATLTHPPADWGQVSFVTKIDALSFYRQAPLVQTKAA